MQAVILAAGKGTRMGALSQETPKPMLVVAGKNLLQHKIDALPNEVDEVILIVHHLKEQIKNFFGDSYSGRKITYVEQDIPQGTAHALWLARPHITGEFISMMGDDIYSPEAIKNALEHPWTMTVSPSPSFPTTMDIKTTPDGYFADAVIDDIGHGGDALVDVCLYKFKLEIFDTPLVKISNKDEWGLVHTLFSFLMSTKTPMKVLRDDGWIKVNTPDDLAKAEAMLRS
jgi:NDP-sugar pyrophosphorylase family protein